MKEMPSILVFIFLVLILFSVLRPELKFTIKDVPGDCGNPILLVPNQFINSFKCPREYNFCYALRYWGNSFLGAKKLQPDEVLFGGSYTYTYEIYGCRNIETTTQPTTSTTQPTTSTTQPTTSSKDCNGLGYTLCISTQGCEWVGNLQTGYCRLILPSEPRKPSEERVLQVISDIFASIWNWIKEVLRW